MGAIEVHSVNFNSVFNNFGFLAGNVFKPASFPTGTIIKKKLVEITAETQLNSLLKNIPSLKPYESAARKLVEKAKNKELPVGADVWFVFFNKQCFGGHAKAVRLMSEYLQVDNAIGYLNTKEIFSSQDIFLVPVYFGENYRDSWLSTKNNLARGEYGLPEFYGLQLMIANIDIDFGYNFAFSGDEHYTPNDCTFGRKSIARGNQLIPDVIVYRGGYERRVRGSIWAKKPVTTIHHVTYWP